MTIDLEPNLARQASHFVGPDKEMERAVVAFCSKMGEVFEIKSFLELLKGQIPKKFKTGELAVFYTSCLGLRRAYIRNSVFYEEEARSPWPEVGKISLSRPEQSSYLAREFGRPFAKTLMVPFGLNKEAGLSTKDRALLFFEISDWNKHFDLLAAFFEKRMEALNLLFSRALVNTNMNGSSYLWSQLFSHWWEPLALIQNNQIVRSNHSLKENLPGEEVQARIKQNKISGSMETKSKIYHLHYYPVAGFKKTSRTGILYCQDMTEHFRLKERVFQNEKMAGLCILGENMAHQLNNPLTGLQSMAQILTGRPELKSFGEDFMEVEKAARRSQKIIESLLSFSSKNKERETICRLNQVVESALSLLKSATRGIALELDFADSGLKTRGDFSILQQVVYNLILNACQALNQTKAERKAPKTLSRSVGLCNQTKTEWKARIHISIRKAPEDKVLLKIRDNGPGIARENLQKIFQTFWTSKKKGTGLGLGMARKFVRELGGDIFVSSRQGEFASFAVFLPSAVSRPSPAKSA